MLIHLSGEEEQREEEKEKRVRGGEFEREGDREEIERGMNEYE